MTNFEFLAKKNIEIKIINPMIGKNIPLPTYATGGSAGLDVRACIKDPVDIVPGQTIIIPSGIAININDTSLMAMIAPRSGLGIKHGIVLANMIGICDSDYHGEIQIGLWNRGNKDFIVNSGDRICQMIFVPVVQTQFDIVDEFTTVSERGQGGLGHTGIE